MVAVLKMNCQRLDWHSICLRGLLPVFLPRTLVSVVARQRRPRMIAAAAVGLSAVSIRILGIAGPWQAWSAAWSGRLSRGVRTPIARMARSSKPGAGQSLEGSEVGCVVAAKILSRVLASRLLTGIPGRSHKPIAGRHKSQTPQRPATTGTRRRATCPVAAWPRPLGHTPGSALP